MSPFSALRRFVAAVWQALHGRPVKATLFAACLAGYLAVDIWDDVAPVGTHDWIADQLKALHVADPGNFHFIVYGDNRGDNPPFASILDAIAADPSIAFVIGSGDLVKTEGKENFRQFIQQVHSRLRVPFIPAPGNHDLEDGGFLWPKIMGPLNYSFRVGPHAFIVFDDNTADSLGESRMQWLERQLADTQDCDTRIVVMHIPLFDRANDILGHCIPEDLSRRLLEILHKGRVTYIFASHVHGYLKGDYEGIPYTISGGGGARLAGSDSERHFFHYLRVHLHHGRVDVEVRPVPSPLSQRWFGPYGYSAWLMVRDLATFQGLETSLLIATIVLGLLLIRPLRRRSGQDAAA
ncbi:MAG: metallophosphoesterase [Planctomycetota bacterium]|nr:metallophosphoesterase [Planctomycetota bacterium]